MEDCSMKVEAGFVGMALLFAAFGALFDTGRDSAGPDVPDVPQVSTTAGLYRLADGVKYKL
jgi:hypothetical protein